MDYRINTWERNALKGLPHLARLVYLEAIRPYMDYATGIVGIKRGISYQSLREELYIEPHQGYASGSPSKDQMRRAIKALERAGLISIQSEGKKLIVKCELATWDYSDQNKVATKPPYEATTKPSFKNNNKTSDCNLNPEKATKAKIAKAATPPESGINNIFVCDVFEKFWQLYPAKQGKTKAHEVFQQLSPSGELLETIMKSLEAQCDYRKEATIHGHWMPNWKHAANWLTQQCWEDELPPLVFLSGEKNSARNKNNFSTKSKSKDAWSEYYKDISIDEHEEHESNIVSLSEYRQNPQPY